MNPSSGNTGSLNAALVFPHQLYDEHPALLQPVDVVWLIEDTLFFGDAQYPMRFHKQKLAYHRATMANYAKRLEKRGHTVSIQCYGSAEITLDACCSRLGKAGMKNLLVAELNDFSLARRLQRAASHAGVTLTELPGPGFINTMTENQDWRASRQRWFMADFYRWQRARLDILMDGDEPTGGQWSLDEENRRKLPKAEIAKLPALPRIQRTELIRQAIDSVERDFAGHPGALDRWYYPVTHEAAQQWLQCFLHERFTRFGPYEDAIVAGHHWLYHAVLTPMLNTGLLTPADVLDQALRYANENSLPLNSVEGFVRQIIGWREFMRATYHDLGVPMRTTNHWQHKRPMPASFYSGTTGIDPVDDVIGRVLDTGYCHHIERLMILGGFMFLCEIDPDEIYRWFMEMFIDSYDWVMVPNVYAMSQHADGGAITTKPYFSGSNYVLKMSNFKKGDWSIIWDGLFWRWIIKHSEALAGNPRWAMMVRNAQKMEAGKRRDHQSVAEKFLASLS